MIEVSRMWCYPKTSEKSNFLHAVGKQYFIRLKIFQNINLFVAKNMIKSTFLKQSKKISNLKVRRQSCHGTARNVSIPKFQRKKFKLDTTNTKNVSSRFKKNSKLSCVHTQWQKVGQQQRAP